MFMTRATQLAVLLGLASPVPCAAAEYKYVSFLSLHGAPTDQFVSANGINDAGTIVGQDGSRGFIFANGVTTYVDVQGSANTSLQAIDGVGDIVGYTFTTLLGQQLGFSFSDLKGVLQPITAVGSDGYSHPIGVIGLNSHGEFVNIVDQDGRPVGQTFNSTLTSSGYRLYGGQIFVPPGANATLPNALNDRGQIVGDYYDATGQHSFLLSGGVYTHVDVPGGQVTIPRGINNRGTIVGTYYDPSQNGRVTGFVLRDGIFTTIYYPGALGGTFVSGIGDGGSIVGYYYDDVSKGTTGFVARPMP